MSSLLSGYSRLLRRYAKKLEIKVICVIIILSRFWQDYTKGGV